MEQESKLSDAELFIKYINDNYDKVGGTLKVLCAQRKQKFDEDAFHTCIIRCYDAINKKGCLNDKSGYGITSYLIRSYFNLIAEEKRAARNKKRDENYNSDNIGGVYEEYYNSNFTDEKEKIVSDLYKDFAVLYMLMVVEENFDNEHFYLFKLKELCKDMTYKKLQEKTNIKGVRQKVLEVKKYIQENVKKEDIKKEFINIYGDLL